MKKVLRFLGYVWATPTTALMLLVWLLPMWAFMQVRPLRWKDGAWEWVVGRLSFLDAMYGSTWAATTLGWCIMYTPNYVDNPVTAVHERRHVFQNWIFGPFFLPLYVIGYAVSFMRGFWRSQHGEQIEPVGWWFYKWNPFELDAYDYQRKQFLATDQRLGHLLAGVGSPEK